MTTIFFGPPDAAQGARQAGIGQGCIGKGSVGTGTGPVAPVLCSVIVVCHLVDRRRVMTP